MKAADTSSGETYYMSYKQGMVTRSEASMASAIKRLRRSKTEASNEDWRRGRAEGEHFAAHAASHRQLQAFEDIAEPCWQRHGKRADEDAGHDLAWALSMYLELRFGEVHTPAEMKTILFPGPERRRSPAHIAGFVVGAGGVWARLEDTKKKCVK